MPKFITLTPIKLSPDEITPENTEVELTDKQAKPLLAARAISAAEKPAAQGAPGPKPPPRSAEKEVG